MASSSFSTNAAVAARLKSEAVLDRNTLDYATAASVAGKYRPDNDDYRGLSRTNPNGDFRSEPDFRASQTPYPGDYRMRDDFRSSDLNVGKDADFSANRGPVPVGSGPSAGGYPAHFWNYGASGKR